MLSIIDFIEVLTGMGIQKIQEIQFAIIYSKQLVFQQHFVQF
mgnify:CR=1 FL=1